MKGILPLSIPSPSAGQEPLSAAEQDLGLSPARGPKRPQLPLSALRVSLLSELRFGQVPGRFGSLCSAGCCWPWAAEHSCPPQGQQSQRLHKAAGREEGWYPTLQVRGCFQRPGWMVNEEVKSSERSQGHPGSESCRWPKGLAGVFREIGRWRN